MAEDPIKAVLHYAQALKAQRIRESAARLAEQARDAGWTHEEYLAAVLSREVAAREASGAATRIRSAGFPTRKSLEDFNFDHQPALNRDMIAVLRKHRNGSARVEVGSLPRAGSVGQRRVTHPIDVHGSRESCIRIRVSAPHVYGQIHDQVHRVFKMVPTEHFEWFPVSGPL